MSKDNIKVKERKYYMNSEDSQKLGDLPRTHKNCFELTKKCRPGKSKKDRALRGL
jgi:hypothetical protein